RALKTVSVSGSITLTLGLRQLIHTLRPGKGRWVVLQSVQYAQSPPIERVNLLPCKWYLSLTFSVNQLNNWGNHSALNIFLVAVSTNDARPSDSRPRCGSPMTLTIPRINASGGV